VETAAERKARLQRRSDRENTEHCRLVRRESRDGERMRPHPGDVSNILTMLIY